MIKNNDVELPDEFKTSWNPIDNKSSSIRSRDFAIKATLSYVVDSLDSYLGLCHRKPALYQDQELLENAGAAGQSVDKKFVVLNNYIGNSSIKDYEKYSAITNLSLKWRNRLVHFFAENEITEEVRNTLKTNADFYKKNFQGLNIDRLLNNFDNYRTPSFKEITSIIRAVHKFVELSDGYLLGKVDLQLHFTECIDFHLKMNTRNTQDIRRKTAQLYNLSFKRRKNSFDQIIMNYGFTKVEESASKIKQESITKISNMNFEKAMEFLNETDYDLKKNYVLE